jgi:hypothetical protein
MLLLDALFSKPLNKRAGMVSDALPSIVSEVKNYFASKYDPQHPTESVINDLAPGAISLLFGGTWGMLLGFFVSVMHVNVAGLIASIYQGVKSLISGGTKTTDQQVDQVVAQAVQQHTTDQSQNATPSNNQSIPQYQHTGFTSSNLLRDAQLIRLGMIQYENQLLQLTKTADFAKLSKLFSNKQAQGTHILGRILGFIFKVALRSTGLLVAGDLANKLVGRPNSIDHTYQEGAPGSSTNSMPSDNAGAPEVEMYTATQTKYPLKQDQPLPATVNQPNTPEDIEQYLLQLTNDTYGGLQDKTDLITSDPFFQFVKEKIAFFNSRDQGYAAIFLPPFWKTQKQLVDSFIDSVAKRDTDTTNKAA